jgi:hypothetical protein
MTAIEAVDFAAMGWIPYHGDSQPLPNQSETVTKVNHT